jgi:hypothetical protein
MRVITSGSMCNSLSRRAAGERMFRFTEDIETALGMTKRGRDNIAYLVSLIEALDLAGLPDEHEIGQLAWILTQFCGPAVTVRTSGTALPTSSSAVRGGYGAAASGLAGSPFCNGTRSRCAFR